MKTPAPTLVPVLGDSAMSTIPAATTNGTEPACSQPRSRGFSSAILSAITTRAAS